MKNGFAKFKRQSKIHTAIKCCVISLSAAMFLIGVILLAAKLADISLLYSLIGLVGLLSGGMAYFFLRRSDMALARKLDGIFGYGEKVQTMLAFENSNGCIIDVQREDTNNLLSAQPAKSLRFEKLWIYILVAVLALALFVVGVALPSKVADAVEPSHEFTDWEYSALDELIEYVKSADVEATLKGNTADSLVALRSLLIGGLSEKALPRFVEQTAESIRGYVYSANASSAISDEDKKTNSDFGNYVVDKLYDVFGIEQQKDSSGGGEGGGENENTKPQGPGSSGSGSLVVGADEMFFDPILGYIKYADAIDDYMLETERAFKEGVISEEEWYELLREYYYYLYGINESNNCK